VQRLGSLSLAILLVTATAVAFSIAPPHQQASAAAAGWITSCQYSHSAPDDPIVFPGVDNGAHLHDFVGARSTDEDSTSASLRAGGTTCTMRGDRSSYWIPGLYVNGTHVPPTATSRDALLYYRRVAAPRSAQVRSLPDGLRVIVGNAKATTPQDNPALATGRIIFKCGPGETTDLPHPPAHCASGVMVVSHTLPNCWNGVDLDSPDHFSHMAYPINWRCPASHPVILPRVEAFFRYPVTSSGPIGEVSFSSGPYYTAHMDFFNAWVPSTLRHFVNTCINALKDCGRDPGR
jgi:hypothetical protein